MFGMPTVISIWIFVGLMVLAVMLLMSMLARLYRKAGPHEALVVYGFRGTRVEHRSRLRRRAQPFHSGLFGQ